MNDTTAAYRLREQLKKFLGIVFPHAPKAQKEFLGQMFFGIQAGQSVVLSRIARELQEDILLKKRAGVCESSRLGGASPALSLDGDSSVLTTRLRNRMSFDTLRDHEDNSADDPF